MTTTAEQQAQQKLDKLSEGFAAWRAGKRHSKEKIPMELLAQARELTEALKTTAVCKRLGISTEAMQRGNPAKTTTRASSPTFTELRMPLPGHSPLLRVEIHTTKGEHIVISNLSAESPSAILAKLLA